MKFKDDIFWIGLSLRRSKPPDNMLLGKGEENLPLKGASLHGQAHVEPNPLGSSADACIKRLNKKFAIPYAFC